MRTAWKWIVAGLLLTPSLTFAGKARPAKEEQAPREEQAPAQEADAEPQAQPGVKPGPAKVELGHDLTLDVPAEHVFLEKDFAAKLLERNGSFHHENLLGIVVSKTESPWFVVLRYEDEGYIKDDEKLDAKEILDAIKEGQEEANKERVERGFKALRIGDWTEAPHYDQTRHHLVWALNASTDEGTSVNYNTRVLGRRGFVSLNLVADPEHIEEGKPEVVTLLQNTSFKPGARYEDFKAGTDKVAEYGLAGLVLGGVGLGAAKLVKIGLLAKGWKIILGVLIAGKKLIVVGLAGLAALARKMFGGKSNSSNNP